MLPKAREVRLKPKDRKVLEARCRAPTTAQRDVKRARMVLLAAAGRSTRSIAADVGVQPRIVSKWRRRYAERGLEDASRIRKNPGIFARLRSFAYNILRSNQSDTIAQDRYAAALGGLKSLLAMRFQ